MFFLMNRLVSFAIFFRKREATFFVNGGFEANNWTSKLILGDFPFLAFRVILKLASDRWVLLGFYKMRELKPLQVNVLEAIVWNRHCIIILTSTIKSVTLTLTAPWYSVFFPTCTTLYFNGEARTTAPIESKLNALLFRRK